MSPDGLPTPMVYTFLSFLCSIYLTLLNFNQGMWKDCLLLLRQGCDSLSGPTKPWWPAPNLFLHSCHTSSPHSILSSHLELYFLGLPIFSSTKGHCISLFFPLEKAFILAWSSEVYWFLRCQHNFHFPRAFLNMPDYVKYSNCRPQGSLSFLRSCHGLVVFIIFLCDYVVTSFLPHHIIHLSKVCVRHVFPKLID